MQPLSEKGNNKDDHSSPGQTPGLLPPRRRPATVLDEFSPIPAEVIDSIIAMKSQDVTYRCQDYLGRRRKTNLTGSMDNQQEELLDGCCREKMCEWSYRVCDHFRTNREIVAFSFSFLDRFVDKCSCDRTAFKLAAMTSLYMAVKIFNSKQISIASLAELSRGEFDVKHVSEMERIILETLNWRMNPPTTQSFIQQIYPLLGIEDETVRVALYNMAQFFSEVCIYDYELVTQDRFLIALACILNSIEGLQVAMFDESLSSRFVLHLKSSLGVAIEESSLDVCRERLWLLYDCSVNQSTNGDNRNDKVVAMQTENDSSNTSKHESSQASHSPISVNDHK